MAISTLSRQIKDLKQRAAAILQEDSPALEPLPFADFLSREFLPAVAGVEGDLVSAPHLRAWAELISSHRFVALIAFRGSLKSTVAKATIAHALREHCRGAYDAVLYSATVDLARWHLRRLKLYIEPLARSWGWRDATSGEAVLRYERPGAIFNCEPAGLDAASRGRRADLLVIDDPCDPRKLASMADIDRSLEALQRRILPLLKSKTARVLLVGTPLIEGDVVEWAERNPEFVTARLPAILDDGRPAWPQKYPLEELEKIKRLVGDKSFNAEYLLQAVAPLDSYISADLIERATLKCNVISEVVQT
jgi:hypothetical protein